MKGKNGLSLVLVGLISIWAPVAPAESQNQAPQRAAAPIRGPSDLHHGGEVRPGGVQQRRLRHHGIPTRQPVGR